MDGSSSGFSRLFICLFKCCSLWPMFSWPGSARGSAPCGLRCMYSLTGLLGCSSRSCWMTFCASGIPVFSLSCIVFSCLNVACASPLSLIRSSASFPAWICSMASFLSCSPLSFSDGLRVNSPIACYEQMSLLNERHMGAGVGNWEYLVIP